MMPVDMLACNRRMINTIDSCRKIARRYQGKRESCLLFNSFLYRNPKKELTSRLAK
jgi:hypothetical protein